MGERINPRPLDAANRSVPAAHECAACGIKVDLSDPNHHVCVYDATQKKWTPSTAKAAHTARLQRAARP